MQMREIIKLVEDSASFDIEDFIMRLKAACAELRKYRDADTVDEMRMKRTAREKLNLVVIDGMNHAKQSMSLDRLNKFHTYLKQVVSQSLT